MRRIGYVLCVTIAIAPVASGQSPRLAVLRGRVLSDSSDIPLKGAEVGVPELSLVARTDSAGVFRLNGIPTGRRIVVVRLLGFAPARHVLDFVAGDSIDADVSSTALASPAVPWSSGRGSNDGGASSRVE